MTDYQKLLDGITEAARNALTRAGVEHPTDEQLAAAARCTLRELGHQRPDLLTALRDELRSELARPTVLWDLDAAWAGHRADVDS